MPDPAAGPDPLAKLPEGLALIAFGASWVGPWAGLCALLDQLEESGVQVRRVDVDAWPHHAETYRVISLPTLVTVRGGKESRRRIGAVSLADLKALTATRAPRR